MHAQFHDELSIASLAASAFTSGCGGVKRTGPIDSGFFRPDGGIVCRLLSFLVMLMARRSWSLHMGLL
jgi:hypothetical protein